MAVVFVIGAAVGSGLNVCIVRIPFEKSILWPSSHCGNCFQRIRWYDNIPLISYWVLRGRCRSCGATFSMRYFLIELFTALVFVTLFYFDIVLNVHDIWVFQQEGAGRTIPFGVIPIKGWLFWMGHALLASFLIVTTFTDLEHMEIPLRVTVTGTLVGLVLSTCFPWPWPNTLPRQQPLRGPLWLNAPPVLGFQPWPLWHPSELPEWLVPGTWQLGLANGIAGVLAGIVIMRGVRFLFQLGRGKEGLGLGDADLMMMAGAFMGWQLVVIAFFASVFPALLLGLVWLILRGNKPLPFGPALALGTLLTLYGWRWIGPFFQILFFDRRMLLFLAAAGAFFLLVISFFLRLIRGNRPEQGPENPSN
jgi:leader peptidase (prepilin peptidase)/N-methyltransferase